MSRAEMKMPKTETDLVIFQGGVDLNTPKLKMKPGKIVDGKNWQCVAGEDGGGYERVGGYERYDGHPSPSGAAYFVLKFDSWDEHPSTWGGSLVSGATSGATGEVLTYVDSAEKYLVLAQATGSFLIGEHVVVTVGPNNVGDIVGFAADISPRDNARYINLAADQAREEIFAVPGEGRILGVASLIVGGVRTVYAWKNWIGSTQARMYKASADSWVEIAFDWEVSFTNGNGTEPQAGDTITQGAESAAIVRVIHESGDWDAGTAAGRLLLGPPSPSFGGGPGFVGATEMQLSGFPVRITLQPNGRYQCVVSNFGGQLTTQRLYGADGVNRAFEFDGTTFVPLKTGAPIDIPKFVQAHQKHLLFMLGSSVIGSGPGVPYMVNSTAGGFEIAVGDEITGSLVQPGNQETGALTIFCRNSTKVMYGTSAADFEVRSFKDTVGALPYMQANLSESYAFDDRGVIQTRAAQEFGNFGQATITANINSRYLTSRKGISVDCCTSADRSQIRFFFSDGSALYSTIVNGKLIGHGTMQFVHPFTCVWSAEDSSGNEETFAGGLDGMVYQLDRGSSFDGEPIDHHCLLAENFMGSPMMNKELRGGKLEVASSFYTEFEVGYTLDYGSSRLMQPSDATYDAGAESSFVWDNFIWDNFQWGGGIRRPTDLDIKGKAPSIGMAFRGNLDFVYPFTLSALITKYNFTRELR